MTQDTQNPAVEKNNDTKPAVNQNDANNTADTGNVNPDNVPYARFNEVTKQNKKLLDKLTAFENKQEESRVAKLEAEGKHNELIAEQKAKLQSYEEKLTYYSNLEQQERDGLLSQIPQNQQEIYQDLSTLKLREHIKLMSESKSLKTDTSGTVRGNSLGIKDDADIWKMDTNDRKKNWGDVLRHFKQKK